MLSVPYVTNTPLAPGWGAPPFLAASALVQHRSCCQSAAAAPALTQLSATQRLPAFEHDGVSPSSCAKLLPSVPYVTSTPPDPEIGASSFLAATSAGATSPTLSMSRHQHHGALCDTVIACIHSMVLKRQAAAGCLRCFKRPICPRNRCATISAHNVRRYSIAHAVIQRQRHQHPRCSLRHSVCLHPQHNAAAQSCCFASPKLHAPHLPPKLVRHDFCAVRPSIQHCSSGNSAAAAPAFTQLSATQRLPASKHDAAPSSSC